MRAGPELAGGMKGSECKLVVLNASDVLHDVLAGLVHVSMRKAKCVRVFFILFTAICSYLFPAQRVVSTLTQAQAAACEERDRLFFQQRGCNPPRRLHKLWLGSCTARSSQRR